MFTLLLNQIGPRCSRFSLAWIFLITVGFTLLRDVNANSNVFVWGQGPLGLNATLPPPPSGYQEPQILDFFSTLNESIIAIHTLDWISYAVGELGNIYFWGVTSAYACAFTMQRDNCPYVDAPRLATGLQQFGPLSEIFLGPNHLSGDAYDLLLLLRNGSMLYFNPCCYQYSDLKNVQAVTFPAGEIIVQLTGIDGSMFALSDSGVMYSWGFDYYGLRGDGAPNTYRGNPLPIPYFAANGIKIQQMIVSPTYSYYAGALSTDGKLYGWGLVKDREYARPSCFEGAPICTSYVLDTPALANMTLNMTIDRVTSSGWQATTPTNGAYIRDTSGQWWQCQRLPSQLVRTPYLDAINPDQIWMGIDAYMALTSNGTVYTWGGDDLGQTGSTENDIPQPVPTTVPFFQQRRARIVLADLNYYRGVGVTARPCASGETSSSCYQCPPGTFADTSLATTLGIAVICTRCPIGTYTNQSGAAGCMTCPGGTYNVQMGLTRCLVCPAGYASSPGAHDCISCAAGSFAPAHSAACEACPQGTFSGPIASQCTPCDPGNYSPSNSTSCAVCPPGTYGSIQGVGVCSPCGLNSYSNTTAAPSQTYCQRCPVLSSTRQVNSTSPDDCVCVDSALYDDAAGSCLCVAGFEYQLASESCSLCSGNSMKAQIGNNPCTTCPPFSLPSTDHTFCTCVNGYYPSSTHQGACTVCPVGGDCTTGELIPQSGYWRADNSSEAFYPCIPSSACLSSGCSAGRVPDSILCATCEAGYMKPPSGECIACPAPNYLIVGVIIIPFVIIILIYVYVSSLFPASPTVTILLNFYQLVNETALVPRPATTVVGFFSLDLGKITPSICVIPASFTAVWAVQLLLPILLFIPITLALYVRKLVKRLPMETFRKEFAACLLTILTFSYVIVTKGAFSMFGCSTPIAGQQLLIADRSIVCWSSQHIPLAVSAAFVIVVFSLGIPLFLGLLVKRPGWWPRVLTLDVSFVTDSYNDEEAGWEVVLMLRRLAFVLVAQVAAAYFIYASAAITLLSLASARLQLYYRPFKEKRSNVLEFESMQALVGCSVLRLLQSALIPSTTSTSSLVLDIFVLIVIVGFTLYLIWRNRVDIKAALTKARNAICCCCRSTTSTPPVKPARPSSADLDASTGVEMNVVYDNQAP